MKPIDKQMKVLLLMVLRAGTATNEQCTQIAEYFNSERQLTIPQAKELLNQLEHEY